MHEIVWAKKGQRLKNKRNLIVKHSKSYCQQTIRKNYGPQFKKVIERFWYLDFEVSQSEGSAEQRTEMCYRWYLPPISDLCKSEKYDKYNISTFQSHLKQLLKQQRKCIYKAVQQYLPCHPNRWPTKYNDDTR